MNLVELRAIARCRAFPRRGFLLWVIAIFGLAGPLFSAAAEPPAPAESTPAADDAAANDGEIVALAAYNAKADRIEDFGLRVTDAFYPRQPKSTMGALFSKFAPLITAVLPNTAAARAGLQPGEYVLKSEGKSTVGGPLSTGKSSPWRTTQAKKWAEAFEEAPAPAK